MHRIQQHQTHNLADAGDGWSPVKGGGLVRLGRLDERQFHSAAQPIVAVNQGEGDRDALRDGRRKELFRHAVPMALVGQLFPDLGPSVLAVRMLDRRKQCGALTRQRQAVSEEVPGRPHRRGRARGLREHAPTEQPGDVLGVDLVVFGLPPWMAFMYRAWPRTKGTPSWAPRAASQYHVKRHATALTIWSREGAMALSKASELAGIFRCSPTAPS